MTERGAGILLVAQDTGRVLLLKRGRDVRSDPMTWAVPGGKVDPGETARAAAMRELDEEAGWPGTMAVMKDPVFVFDERPGFEFLTYLGFVKEEFDPQLNRESDDAGWFSLSKLPRPLHPGVKSLFRDTGPSLVKEIRRISWQD